MQKHTFTTSVPATDEIAPGRFVAASCANEMNLTGSLQLRGTTIAYDVFIARHGTGLNGVFLRDGQMGLTEKGTEVIRGGTPWWETASKEERDLIGEFLLQLRDFVNIHEETHAIPTPDGVTKQYFSPFPLEWVPESIWVRITTLADWYRYTLDARLDGKPNGENRHRSRYARYWRGIAQVERRIMWKVHPTLRPAAQKNGKRKYTPPTPAEERALEELSLTLTRHYLPAADLIEALHLLEDSAPELPKLPASFLERIDEILACDGFWKNTSDMLVTLPAHEQVWPQLIQDLVQAMLRQRIQAAAHGWTLLWPPAEVCRLDGRTHSRSVQFKQLTVAHKAA